MEETLPIVHPPIINPQTPQPRGYDEKLDQESLRAPERTQEGASPASESISSEYGEESERDSEGF